FFAPTHACWRPARTGAVKAGRRSTLATRSAVSRPRLDSPEHGGTLGVVGMTCPRGSSLSGREGFAPQPCIRWAVVTQTMMHACASAAKLRGGGPILKAGIAAMGESGPHHLELSSHHARADGSEAITWDEFPRSGGRTQPHTFRHDAVAREAP